jgi:hypothetical protein
MVTSRKIINNSVVISFEVALSSILPVVALQINLQGK